MAGVLAVVLGVALGVTYVTLARSAVAAAQDRLERGARQLATVGGNTIRQGAARYEALARDSVIVRALRAATGGGRGGAPADTLLRATLARLTAPTDSGIPTELWTADGRRLLVLGEDQRATVRVAPRGGDDALPPPVAVPREGLDAAARSDSLTLGGLYAVNGRTRFWLAVPVRDRGTTLGYIVQQRRLAGSAQTERTIRELTGDAVAAHYRNRDGDYWSTLAGAPAPPSRLDSTRGGVVRTRPGLGEVLFAEHAVDRTPFLLVFELPRSWVLSRPRAVVLQLALVSLALLGVGTAASWVIARRITRPIASLTRAAEAIARGDYSARAEAAGDDEVAQLAESFTRMGREVAGVRSVLERQSEEARATAAELARSNEELVAAREAAEAASRAKSEFLAVMSHELRTPLNAIGGYAELLEMELRGPLTDAQRRDLARIRASQQHLLGLVSAVLDLGRIERRQVAFDLAPVPLAPFLLGLEALVAPQAAAQRLRIEYVPCDDGLAAVADREKLRQILLNLLSNAIRYTPPGGKVTLEARPDGESEVAIRVRDTGVGIPADQHAKIFEPFVQLDRSLTNVREGVGLGLAISRDLARGMRGDLTVESHVDEGSCFTLTLPRGVLPEGAVPLDVTGERPAATR